MDIEVDVRCLRYRLKRQGMLELDEWLSGLDAAILSNDVEILHAVQLLLACEVPELLAMMQGDMAMPHVLKPWLQ